jgi:hypothetical protein
MGSVTSTPKLPKTQQPLIINMPTASYAPPASNATTSTNTTTDTGITPGSATPTREENLLTRSRGVLGTVLTGLRGVLADTSAKTGSRKTLLGE